MQNYLYSIIGVIALIVHVIINPFLFKKGSLRDGVSKSYYFLMLAIFSYYITDACWGLFAGLNNIPLLFVDTTVYFVAMAAAVVFWIHYVIDYLSLKSFYSRTLKIFAKCFFIVEIAALFVNLFYKCFFWFDENDAYQVGFLRYAALWIQVGLFSITVLITGWKTLKATGIAKARYRAIFLFSIDMVVANIFQSLYPLYPVYAIGCLIGSVILHVYVVEDERDEYRRIIAEEKKLSDAANKAKTSFLFNMSHDIRTPMNAILGYTAMARKKSQDKAMDDLLAKIDIAGNQLLSLVNQVLEMARIESGRIVLQEQKINMEEGAEVVRTVYGGQAEALGLKLSVEVRNLEHPHVIGDNDRISQITNNLVGNALKYTQEGGSILTYVEEEPCEREGFAVYRMVVEDTGIGMSEDFLPHIFEEFSREESSTVSSIQGTGLGMPIVKKLVDLMCGTIEVESKLGAGTRFTVRLPLRIDTNYAEEDEGEASAPDITIEGLKILLVDDNEMNREIAQDILKDAGGIVDVAEDGVIAVEKIENSASGTYDVVLMDIQMPRMNGYEAAGRIRALENKELANIKIFAMTANAFAEDRQNALDAGMDGHLAKPIDVKLLLKTLSELQSKV